MVDTCRRRRQRSWPADLARGAGSRQRVSRGGRTEAIAMVEWAPCLSVGKVRLGASVFRSGARRQHDGAHAGRVRGGACDAEPEWPRACIFVEPRRCRPPAFVEGPSGSCRARIFNEGRGHRVGAGCDQRSRGHCVPAFRCAAATAAGHCRGRKGGERSGARCIARRLSCRTVGQA